MKGIKPVIKRSFPDEPPWKHRRHTQKNTKTTTKNTQNCMKCNKIAQIIAHTAQNADIAHTICENRRKISTTIA
jgi:hypothetical protein